MTVPTRDDSLDGPPLRRGPIVDLRGIAALLVVALTVCLASCSGSGDPPPETTLSAGGVNVAARVATPTGPATGPTVLFLHGASYTSKIWEQRGILDHVASQGSRAVAIDLPGAGQTPSTLVDPVTFLDQVINALGGQPVVLVAPSASGNYALPYLTKHPDRLAGFVPVAPVGGDTFKMPSGVTAPPTIVVLGANDASFSAGTRHLAEAIPGATLEVIANAGHAAYDDQPEAFERILDRLL